jgi:hypothetical protein
MLEAYDAPLSLPLIAPRPLLLANGELDPRCPMAGVREALAAAAAAYAARGAAGALELFEQPGVGHQETEEMRAAVRGFFDRRLLL